MSPHGVLPSICTLTMPQSPFAHKRPPDKRVGKMPEVVIRICEQESPGNAWPDQKGPSGSMNYPLCPTHSEPSLGKCELEPQTLLDFDLGLSKCQGTISSL